jgi:Protein of unknown function (DUF2939)
MNPRFTIAGVAVLAIVVSLYLVSPFLFLRSLTEAARLGNRDAIEADVDFPAVRDGLRAQLGIFLARRALGKTQDRSLHTGLALLILPSVGNSLIDAIVTPAGMASILNQRIADSGEGVPRPSLWRWQFSWIDLDHLRARYIGKARTDETLTIVIERQSLMNWKVVSLDLPLDRLAK